MSRVGRRGLRDQKRAAASTVPAVLHVITVRIVENGAAQLSLDGQPRSVDLLTRENAMSEIHAVVARLGEPCRVVVLEADGRRFLDILHPVAPASAPSGNRTEPALELAPRSEVPAQGQAPVGPEAVFEVVADGFFSGETVEVLLVASAVIAQADGSARVKVPYHLAPNGPASVLLRGRISSGLLQTPAAGR